MADPVFESGCEKILIEVTSLHRPDTDWRVTDAQGHEHRWYVTDPDGTARQPADYYDPRLKLEKARAADND